jgi:hypothetical protein
MALQVANRRPGSWLTRWLWPWSLVLGLLLAACQAGGSPQSTNPPGASSSSKPVSSPTESVLPSGCSDNAPCTFAAGQYRIGDSGVIPGLQLTLPAGWSSVESNQGELNLVPPGQPDERLFFWLGMVAVKSTGPGHGTTILKNVGKSPKALIDWLTHNRDFLVVAPPSKATIGGVPMQALTIGVSRSARYGDPGCPANPRCADLFTNPIYWGPNFYGIGGEEEAALYLGTIHTTSGPQTMIVALDGPNHADVGRLSTVARPIIESVRLPAAARP